MDHRVRRAVQIGWLCAASALATACAAPDSLVAFTTGPQTLTTVTTTIYPAASTVIVKITETAPAPEVTVRVTVTQAAPEPATAFRDGQHIVGRDIQPGTYRASTVSDICYWERKDEAGDVIANAFGTVATIRSGDFTFQSNRCGTWSLVD